MLWDSSCTTNCGSKWSFIQFDFDFKFPFILPYLHSLQDQRSEYKEVRKKNEIGWMGKQVDASFPVGDYEFRLGEFPKLRLFIFYQHLRLSVI